MIAVARRPESTKPPSADISAGSVHEFPYPFVRELYDDGDPEGGGPSPTWRPGVRQEEKLRYGGDGEYIDYTDYEADAIGRQRLTVVSVHKPGAFPTRVFYTRTWIDPNGKPFGKGNCRIKSLGAFKRLIKGYHGERFRIKDTVGAR